MPRKQLRSDNRGLPPFGLGTGNGKRGSMSSHNASGIRAVAMSGTPPLHVKDVPILGQVAGREGVLLGPLNLKQTIEARYDCCFNSIECHLHEDEHSKVRAHRDAQPGYIAMVSVGQTRRFSVQERTVKTYLLAHGSLLTFFGRIEHSMPAETHPCKARISLIFRYNPKGLVESGSKRTAEQKRTDRAEFEKAQAEWKQAQVGVRKQKAAADKW